MSTRTGLRKWLVAMGSLLPLTACGDDSGACVSDPVTYNFGVRTYCYENWDESDCDRNADDQTNGADWTFYSGQSCADRGLHTGSN